MYPLQIVHHQKAKTLNFSKIEILEKVIVKIFVNYARNMAHEKVQKPTKHFTVVLEAVRYHTAVIIL